MHPKAPLLFLTVVLSAGVNPAPAENAAFVHTADGTNTSGYWTLLEHPSLVDLSTVPIVTQNWNPGGSGGTYNDHPVSVGYDFGGSFWLIVNTDLTAMPLGASFNVLVVELDGVSSDIHEALDSNTTGFVTEPAHPTLIDASAIALVNQLLLSAAADVHPIGLLWTVPSSGPPFRWYVANLDAVAMPYGIPGGIGFPGTPGPTFHVFVASPGPSAFRHEALASTITNNWTTIDSPLLNGRPNALVFISSVGFGSLEPPNELGVWYDAVSEKWAIFNQNKAPMTLGATFNVVVVDPIFDDGFESGNTSAWTSALP